MNELLSIPLQQIQDVTVRDNLQKIVDFLLRAPFSGSAFQAVELYVTANATGIKINHALGAIPKDVILTQLSAPSAARLVVNYASFTSSEVSFDVSGLASGEKLHARLLVGTLPNVVTAGDSFAEESATQQLRSKF